MTLSKQAVLNHCQGYFIDKIQNSRGLCPTGWIHPGDHGGETKCALASLTSKTCTDVWHIVPEVERILGIKWKNEPEDSFYTRIVRFNDHHSVPKHALTYEILDEFMYKLADDFGLEYVALRLDNKACNKIRDLLNVSET